LGVQSQRSSDMRSAAHRHRPGTGLRVACTIATTAACTACTSLPEAPTELSELSSWLFQNFEAEDPVVLAAGMGNLQAFFEAHLLDGRLEDQAWELTVLTDEHIVDVEHPDRDPAAAVPVGLVELSNFTPGAHAQVILLEDQTPVEPASPNLYERSFLEPTEPSCFLDRTCATLRTDNHIRKENLVMSIEYSKRKDYRWSELMREDRETEHGIIGRSWFEDQALGEQEATAIHQSYSIDVFLPHGDDGSMRYVALWTEASMYGMGDDIIQATMRDGLQDMLEATEGWLGEQSR